MRRARSVGHSGVLRWTTLVHLPTLPPRDRPIACATSHRLAYDDFAHDVREHRNLIGARPG
jgi:hypothetical protein